MNYIPCQFRGGTQKDPIVILLFNMICEKFLMEYNLSQFTNVRINDGLF